MRAREKFDETREFLVNKPFRWSGKFFELNTVFPKGIANTRRLRQLYDARWLTMSRGRPVELVPLKPAMPDFTKLSPSGVIMWLANNGFSGADQLEETTPLPMLAKIAKAHWCQLNNVPLEVKPGVEVTFHDRGGEYEGRASATERLKPEQNENQPVEGEGIALEDVPPPPKKKVKVNGKPTSKRAGKPNRRRLQRPVDDGNPRPRNSLRRR